MTPDPQLVLTPRQEEILVRVVEEYVATGAPVGSKTLVERAAMEVSSSTVRYELAVLEEQGLLSHPHTSAGRVPTDLGYRFFVDRVIERLEPRPSELALDLDFSELRSEEFADVLHALLPWPVRRRLDAEAPSHFAAPSGSSVPIDYEAEEGPKLAIRVQELFGLDRHPSIANGRVPLVLELLSPAQRPVQVTRDLPGFWRGSYAAVKAEMRGRYPRHPWPDDPLTAAATRRAKPRAR